MFHKLSELRCSPAFEFRFSTLLYGLTYLRPAGSPEWYGPIICTPSWSAELQGTGCCVSYRRDLPTAFCAQQDTSHVLLSSSNERYTTIDNQAVDSPLTGILQSLCIKLASRSGMVASNFSVLRLISRRLEGRCLSGHAVGLHKLRVSLLPHSL